MVTAIVIPIICLYFFWLTRKEMRENDIKWLAAADPRQEAVVSGEIKSIRVERQRFYYHRYLIVQELKLQTETKLVKARKITPIRKNFVIETFTIGDMVRVYGCWEGTHFLFSAYDLLISKCTLQKEQIKR